MKSTKITLVVLCFISYTINAQTTITARLIDSTKQEPIPTITPEDLIVAKLIALQNNNVLPYRTIKRENTI